MRSWWPIAALLVVVPSASALAQQSHLDPREQIEQFTPKSDPNAFNPRLEANSINPSTKNNSINSRIEANSTNPSTDTTTSVNSRVEANPVNSNTVANTADPRVDAELTTPRVQTYPIAPAPEANSVRTGTDSGRAVLESEPTDASVGGSKKVELLVNVDKSRQAMTVSLDGVKTYEWPVSTGKAGYSTPSGTYTATSMNKVWYSKEWDNAPMPHSIFFMKDGHAIHGSLDVRHLGQPVSHGCVRLSPENAATLYAMVAKNGLENTHVTVSGATPGGEYKVAKPTLSPHPVTASRVPARTQPGKYGDPQYSSQRGYYAQVQPQYYAQPTYPGSGGQSGVRYYYQPQGYHFGMRSPDW